MQAEKGIIKISQIEDLKPKNSNESNLDKPESIVTTVKNTNKPDLSDKLNTKDASVLSNTIRDYSESSMKANNSSKIGASNVKSVANKNTKPLSQQSNENISKYNPERDPNRTSSSNSKVQNQISNISLGINESEHLKDLNKIMATPTIDELKHMPLLILHPLLMEQESPLSEYNAMINNNALDKKIKFGLQVGLNNSITNYSSLSTSHLPFIGIFINKRIANKWEIGLEAQIKWVSNYELKQVWRQELFDHKGLVLERELSFNIDGYRSLDVPSFFKLKNK